MDVEQLIERLAKIDSLLAGATTPGERIASEEARERVTARLQQVVDEPRDFQFTLTSRWSQKLFVALARRYGLKPFRRRRQHATTIMLNVKPSFLDGTFMPHFKAIHDELVKHFDEIAAKVIEAAVHRDLSELQEVVEPKQLAMPVG